MKSEPSSADGSHDGPPDEVALRNARTELERAARLALAGELVAAITHDLRQPLTAVEMNVAAALHLLRASSHSQPDAIAALVDAQEQQRRMSDALHVLQDLAVRRDPFFDAIDVVPIVRDVVRLVGTDALARQVPIGLEVVPPIPFIMGDAVLVHQAILNVLLDALEGTSRDAVPASPVRVKVRHLGDEVEITVSHVGATHGRATVEQWGLAVVRSVVDTHLARFSIEQDSEHGISVVTGWPVAPVQMVGGASPTASLEPALRPAASTMPA